MAETFLFLYVKLATVQIWEQLNKFSLTCSSLKCLLLVKNSFEKTALKKFLFRKQIPPTKTVNWVPRKLSKSALGKNTYVHLLVKFIEQSSINPSVSHCSQRRQNCFCCWFFFFFWKLGRQKWERPLEGKLEQLGGKKVSKGKHGSFK